MDNSICRAITFINYNIPIRSGTDTWDGFEEYLTTGFFDRMYTRQITCNYTDDQLKELWDYNIECIAKGDGRYAHQNIFCFSKDEWNNTITDADFWSPNKFTDMLLTFIVFVQTKNYFTNMAEIEKQCHAFEDAAHEHLQSGGHVYTYVTVDKNDFVICIRSKIYKEAVNAIMALHQTGCPIVYSYSVFAISKIRHSQLTDQEYTGLNDQRIDSISLKGVTNSTTPENQNNYTLDQKYYSFCIRLVNELYSGICTADNGPDFKIYDILGDNDFRLIARMVPLGNLLKQYKVNGLLNYAGDTTQFTFFSTHLILNTQDISRQSQMSLLDDDTIANNNQLLKMQYKTELCEKLKYDMDQIRYLLKQSPEQNQYSEKLIAACHGVYQLLQSLTALEAAPTKKYDFFSLYYPMKTLVSILNEKSAQIDTIEDLAENELLYDFIHKISMTLHGTLRTDIQFFQIRDFNATVHYAPARLRAYYTFFVFMLSAHIKEISQEQNEHSYIFSPGMFRNIFVQQLFNIPSEKKRLMLITVPERYLYFPKNLSIILTHEVGHLAGDKIRKRSKRHLTFLQCSYRVLCLEITKRTSYKLNQTMDPNILHIFESSLPFADEDFFKSILHIDHQLSLKSKGNPYQYYSGFSFKSIHQIIFRKAGLDFGHNTWNKYCGRLKTIYQDYLNNINDQDTFLLAREAKLNYLFHESMINEINNFYNLFRIAVLPNILKEFHYIMTEAVSDILAVLVLGLSPEEYLTSLADEVKSASPANQFNKGINKIRVALVIHTIEILQQEYCTKALLQSFLPKWETVYKDLLPSFKKGSTVYNLTLEAYGYKKSLIDKNSNIKHYRSLFNQKTQVYSKSYDFLNDQIIFDKIYAYLISCAKEYVKQLLTNPQFAGSREIVSNAFRNCVDKTPLDLMQQVDSFLDHFENEWKNKYF